MGHVAVPAGRAEISLPMSSALPLHPSRCCAQSATAGGATGLPAGGTSGANTQGIRGTGAGTETPAAQGNAPVTVSFLLAAYPLLYSPPPISAHSTKAQKPAEAAIRACTTQMDDRKDDGNRMLASRGLRGRGCAPAAARAHAESLSLTCGRSAHQVPGAACGAARRQAEGQTRAKQPTSTAAGKGNPSTA